MKRVIDSGGLPDSRPKRVRFNDNANGETNVQAFGESKAAKYDEEGRELLDKKGTHTLDSDEEEEIDHSILPASKIGGQEAATIDRDGDTAITPFNMNDEEDEGHFDQAGNFVFDKDEDTEPDAWVNSISSHDVSSKAPKIEEVPVKRQYTNEEKIELAKEAMTELKPGEAIEKALKRIQKSRLTPAEERKLRYQAKRENKEFVNPVTEKIAKIMNFVECMGHENVDTWDIAVIEEWFETLERQKQELEESTDVLFEILKTDGSTEVFTAKQAKEFVDSQRTPLAEYVRKHGQERYYDVARFDFELYM